MSPSRPVAYTDENIAEVDEVYAAEQVRAAGPDFIGNSLGKMAKGPLTVTDVICFQAGGYVFVAYAPSVGWRTGTARASRPSR